MGHQHSRHSSGASSMKHTLFIACDRTVHVIAAAAYLGVTLVMFAPVMASAQSPGSAFTAGATGAPSSSLHGAQPPAPSGNAPAAPAWTPRTAVRNDAPASAQ